MIDEIITHPLTEMGAQIREDGTFSFRVWAPNAKAVAMYGSFNDWKKNKKVKLEPEDGGYWSVTTDKLNAGDEYKYLIQTEGGDWLDRNDPYARVLTNSAGNAIVYVDQFDWEEDQFEIPTWNDLVIYEMHIGTFNVKEEGQPGTFASAIERLDYLKDMGINCVEVMPINEYAGDFSWGYNPAYPFAVEEAYGGPDEFKQFVKEAHRRGIAVILDVVYNHFGPSDLGLWQFDGWSQDGKGGIYFYNDWRSNTPWGDTRPDYGREEVRHYIFQNALMWLEEYRCDGLRMDMVPYIRNVYGDETPGNDIPEGFTLLKWINQTIRERHPNKLVVAEDLHSNDFITDDVHDGGCGFGSQWDADFVHPVRKTLIAAEDAHRDMDAIVNAVYKKFSGDVFHRVIYTDSHDEVANGSARLAEEAGNSFDDYYSMKKVGLGAALVMTAPGIPMLFQGQELLEDKWFSDQDPIDWKHLDHFNGINLLFKDLIHLRRNLKGKSSGLQGQHTLIVHANNVDKVFAMLRWKERPEDDGVLVVLNFSNTTFEEYKIGLPVSKAGELIFNSDWKGYSEKFDDSPVFPIEVHPEGYDNQPYHVNINLPAYGALIYTFE